MRKKLLIASTLLLSVSLSFAQKNEVKAAEKALKGGKTTEAKTAIDAAFGMLSGADNKTKANIHFIKGQVN